MIPDYIKNHKFSFDVFSVDDKLDYRITFPQMNDIPSWKKYPNKKEFNGICKYILFLYDKGTPFVNKFRDLKKRREEALSESGLEGEFGKKVAEMEDEKVIQMIVGFLMYQNDRLWTEIVVHESLFAEYTGILLKPMNETKDKDLISSTNAKQKTREELSSVRLQLEKLYDEFYSGDSDLKEQVSKVYKFTPESISKALK